MTIQVKYWSSGSPPAWENIEVTSCFIRETSKLFFSNTSVDGVNVRGIRVYFLATIQFFKEYDSTTRQKIEAFLNAKYKMIADDRYTLYKKDGSGVTFNSSNTVIFVNSSDVTPSRSGSSRLQEEITVELISEEPQ